MHDSPSLLDEYAQEIAGKAAGTVDVYQRILRDLTAWLAERPGNRTGFQPEQLTQTALAMYLEQLKADGYSRSHRARVKAVVSGFARWLSLIERADTTRGTAIFALGYWAGCRVSDVAWLEHDYIHITTKAGSITVGHKAGKQRTIDLHNEARRPLYDYIHHGGRDPESPYVFTSQRSQRLTEAGIHHWFRGLKALATRDEWELIATITFHDLRHDFAHRARAAGWSLEELAYYLGHVTASGAPAIQTTIRYTQVSRDQIKPKLRALQG